MNGVPMSSHDHAQISQSASLAELHAMSSVPAPPRVDDMVQFPAPANGNVPLLGGGWSGRNQQHAVISNTEMFPSLPSSGPAPRPNQSRATQPRNNQVRIVRYIHELVEYSK